MPDDPWLAAKGLRSGYGGKPVLQGVNFELSKGEIVAFIGRNGAGKSTLMKTLIGLLAAKPGEIYFRGTKIQNLAGHRRTRLGVGYVPQGRDEFARMTVAENLAASRIMSRKPNQLWLTRISNHLPFLKEGAI